MTTTTRYDVTRDELADLTVIDVRNPGETEDGTLEGAITVQVARLRDEIDELSDHKESPVVAICAGGYRSSIAASLLRANGFTDVSDLLGGYGALG